MTVRDPGGEGTLDATTPDLRVARIVEARRHPDADRLLVLEVDLGGERRQLVAGVAGHYGLDELREKRIVVVANLKPAKLRGEVSEGMLLAGERDGQIGLLLAPDAEAGTQLKAPSRAPPPGLITIEEFAGHELVAAPDRVTLDGEALEGARLVADRQAFGKLS